MSFRRSLLCLAMAVWLGLVSISPAAAQADDRDKPALPAGWSFLTLERNFDRILADWREPYTGVKIFGSEERDDTSMEASIGAYVCLGRHHAPEFDQTWQFGLEGSFFALFDWADGGSLESQAADYRVGFVVSYSRGPIQGRLQFGHLSSHPGDDALRGEWADAEKIYWEDLHGLISWQVKDWIRIYAGGRVYLTHRDEAGSVDFQGGVELTYPLENSALTPYLAADFQSQDRTDNGLNLSLEGGIKIAGLGNRLNLRLYAFYYDGDDPSAVFSQVETTRYGAGFSIDY